MHIFPKIIYKGDVKKAKKLWRSGVREYEKLLELKKLGGLEQNERLVVDKRTGVIIKCKTFFNLGIVVIYVPVTVELISVEESIPGDLFLVVHFSPETGSTGLFCTDSCFIWDMRNSKIKKIKNNKYHAWNEIQGKLLGAKVQNELPLYNDFHVYGRNSGAVGTVPQGEINRTLLDDCGYTAPEYQLWHYQGESEVSVDHPYTRPDGVFEPIKRLRENKYSYDLDGESYHFASPAPYGGMSTLVGNGWDKVNKVSLYPSYRRENNTNYASSVYGTCKVGVRDNDIICFPVSAELDNEYVEYTRVADITCNEAYYGGAWTKDVWKNHGFILNSPIGSKRIIHGLNEYRYNGPVMLGGVGSYYYYDQSLATVSRLENNYTSLSGYIPSGKYAGTSYQIIASLLLAKRSHSTGKYTITGYDSFSYPIYELTEHTLENTLLFKGTVLAGCDVRKILPESIDVVSQQRNIPLEDAITDFINQLDYDPGWNANSRMGHLSAFFIDMNKFK